MIVPIILMLSTVVGSIVAVMVNGAGLLNAVQEMTTPFVTEMHVTCHVLVPVASS